MSDVLLSDFVSPYDILDISPSASTAEIKARYRSLVLMHHPDKNRGICSLLTRDYFEQIQKAYKQLMLTRREADLPEEMIDYDIETNLELDLDEELREILEMGDVQDNKFNVELSGNDRDEFNEVFNRRFNEVNEKFKELRISQNVGYKQFEHRLPVFEDIVKRYNPDDVLYGERPVYSPIKLKEEDFQVPTENKIPYTDAITNYDNCFSPVKVSSSFGNFGLTKLDNDIAVGSGGKNSLSCGDLGKVYNDKEKVIMKGVDPKESTEELLKDKIKEREYDYVIPTEEDAMKELEEKKTTEENDYLKEKEEYDGILRRAYNASKRILWG